MADREMIAATLAAGILSGNETTRSAAGVKIAVDLYREILAALAKVDADAHPPT